MDGSAWDLVWSAARLSQFAVSAVLFSWFAGRFLARGVRSATTAYLALMVLTYWIPVELTAPVGYAVPMAGAFLLLWAADRRRVFSALFVCVTFYTLRISQIGSNVYSLVYSALVRPGMPPLEEFQGFIWCNLAEVAASSLILLVAVWLMARLYPEPERPLAPTECFLLIAPCAAAIASYSTVAFTWSQGGYGGDGISISGARTLQEIVCDAAIVATVLLFSRLRRSEQDEQRSQILASQIGSMRSYIARVEDMAQAMRAARHDLRGHMQTLQDLEMAGARSAALEYAEAAERSLRDTFEDVRTGNPVTDVILSGFSREAQKAAIPFSCGFQWPAGLSFDAFDIGALLHNALSNAMEAQQGLDEPFVEVRSFVRGRSLLLEVANRSRGADLEACPPALPSTKPDAERHGLGLPSILATARKYGGTAEVSRQDGVFRLRVLLSGGAPTS